MNSTLRDHKLYSEVYTNNLGFEAHQLRYRRRKVLEIAAAHPHARVLEVGVGLEPLFEHLDFEIFTVIEPSPEFAASARERAGTNDAIEIIQASLEQAAPALAGRNFDFIVAASVLHEVDDPEQFLRALHGLCHAQTIVHVSVPNARSLHRLLAVDMGLIDDIKAHSELARSFQRRRTYDASDLEGIARTAGFEIESSGSLLLKPFSHGQMQACLDAGIINGQVLDAMYSVVDAICPELGSEIFANLRRTNL